MRDEISSQKKEIPSLLTHLESASDHHLITHLRQNSKNQIRKIVTIDPAAKEESRKARILQSFANKKIAAIVRADLEKSYGFEKARSAFNEETYEHIVTHGLTVAQGRQLYLTAAAL